MKVQAVRYFFFALLVSFGTSGAASARPAGWLGALNHLDLMVLGLASISDYQIGSEWGKHAVTAQEFAGETAVFQRLASATAKYGWGGTAFYLGKFNGHHVMATNYHVMKGIGCNATPVRFQMLNKSTKCVRSYGMWSDIDFSLFVIDVPAQDEAAFAAIAHNFDFDAPIYTGQELLTIGFGSAGNPGGKLMAGQDSDCKVFSGTNEFRFMGDPDEFNPGPYKAWSFANGCDVSHGDSGSAFVDRKTGELIGLIWTGRIPKQAKTRDSAYLAELIKTQGPDIWAELSYAVPAAKIREKLIELVNGNSLDADGRATLDAIIRDRRE